MRAAFPLGLYQPDLLTPLSRILSQSQNAIFYEILCLFYCHFHYDFLEDFRVVCPLFFDDRIFFDVPLGQVSCGCDEVGWTTLVHGRLRYWVILLFVRHPAACGGWTLE